VPSAKGGSLSAPQRARCRASAAGPPTLRAMPLGSGGHVTGAVLAGGAGRRLGRGAKAAAELAGRPLVSYPLQALSAVCDRVAVVCKPATKLPELDAERWDEPEQPRHPRTGILHALERAGGPVLVCAADMPFVTPDACRTLLARAGAAEGAPAAVAVAGGRLEPVFGLYAPAAVQTLRDAPNDAPLTQTVESLDPIRVALPPALVRSVNTPEELAAAEATLLAR
jgi:molybdopterin-guanine dinucleotide biosynthesis protein A